MSEVKRCDGYRRPDGIMGGPCTRCGKLLREHPVPPPRAYSCPWYELVEEQRPHGLWEEPRVYHEFAGQKFDPPKVSIAQCWYDLVERRDDGTMVLRFGPWLFDVGPGEYEVFTANGRETRPGWLIQVRASDPTNARP